MPIGALFGGLIGLLLQMTGHTHILFYLYFVGGLISTIAICNFIPIKTLPLQTLKQPPYLPSFQLCIRLREFKIIFLLVTITYTINLVFINSTGTYFSCSTFNFLHIIAGDDDKALATRSRYAWMTAFWYLYYK